MRLYQQVKAHASADGDGVRIQRLTGFTGTKALDPFLMLDELRSASADDYIGGFPEHPHRGFETITYLKAGKMRHRDHLGNSGLISDGGAQWMVAGRGVIHSEMPEQTEGLLHGFQFWLNLPAREKMQPPHYRDIAATEIPSIEHQGVEVHLIAGMLNLASAALSGPIGGQASHPLVADLVWTEAGDLSLPTDPSLNLFIYVYQGAIRFDPHSVLEAGSLGYLQPGDTLDLSATTGTGALLFGGRPLHEPVAHYGPFVMNTQAEIEDAVAAFRAGRLTD